MTAATPIARHPDPEQLRRYALGLLAGEPTESVERHLAGCDRCCRLALEAPGDRLVTLLRRPVRSVPPRVES